MFRILKRICAGTFLYQRHNVDKDMRKMFRILKRICAMAFLYQRHNADKNMQKVAYSEADLC
jgi:hypothetical protein